MFSFEVSEKDGVIEVDLKGRLDATQAPALMEEMRVQVGKPITKIIYHADELEYIASAGLRVIIFTKQKIGYEADIIVENASTTVKSIMDMTGLEDFVTFVND